MSQTTNSNTDPIPNGWTAGAHGNARSTVSEAHEGMGHSTSPDRAGQA